MNSNVQSVPTQEALALVTNRTRLVLIRHLIATDGEAVELDELIDRMRRDRSVSTPRSNSENLRTELQHVHLPKLDGMGVVDYDVRSTTVRYNFTDNLEKLVTFIATEL